MSKQINKPYIFDTKVLIFRDISKFFTISFSLIAFFYYFCNTIALLSPYRAVTQRFSNIFKIYETYMRPSARQSE